MSKTINRILDLVAELDMSKRYSQNVRDTIQLQKDEIKQLTDQIAVLKADKEHLVKELTVATKKLDGVCAVKESIKNQAADVNRELNLVMAYVNSNYKKPWARKIEQMLKNY